MVNPAHPRASADGSTVPPDAGDGATFADPAESFAVAALEAMPGLVAVVDMDADAPLDQWTVAWMNPAGLAMSGYDRADLTQGRVSDWMGLDAAAPARRALAERRPFTQHTTVRRRDGFLYPAEVSMTPLGPVGDGGVRWLLTARDMSEDVETTAGALARAGADQRARLGLSLVARVSDILADTASNAPLGDIAALLMRRVVGWAAFYVDGPTLHEVDDLGGEPQRTRDLRRIAQLSPDVEDPVRDLLLDSRMRTIDIDTAVDPEPGTVTAELIALVRAAHDGADVIATVLPVLGRQRVLGLLAVTHREADPWAEGARDDDRNPDALAGDVTTVLELVARRVGMAMDNSYLYDREHRLAETLQRAMLPEQAEISGLDVWTYYSPNAEHAQVGGDWYDVLQSAGQTVGLVIGDVVGHDVEAAASMGQLRSVVRAYSAEFGDPGTVLERVDRLIAGMRIPRSASLVYAALTPLGDGAWDIAYSRAGHLPPLLVRGGDVRSLDGAGGALIGFGNRPRQTAHERAEPGDVLVFYTDGLVERRNRTMRDGVEALTRVCAAIDTPDAAGVGEELLLRLAEAPEDDVAVVIVRVPDPVGDEPRSWVSPRQRRWQMPVDPQTISRSRHALLRACQAWGIEDTAAAELVVSELVANAVMHGWGRVDLRLEDTGDGLRIEVEDGNPAPPVTRERHSGRVGGFGLHIIDRLADWGWRPTPGGKAVWARLRPQHSGRVRPTS
ncbi:SpoIIE family protein phosphatase [Georgenia faecalis]|uniref:SpoIIE family protein phosphatase n=1 Tax=Georgenia faecalis TaxID=2483799 RepID=A0ABV9D949_9MICO|nr:SpoIIE family protein phosphatase [Georgenia faecalis]